jgi:RimJ/RimL family protein N-acetyltransferase
VRLRRFIAQDAPAVHRWFNDDRATQNLLERRRHFSLLDAEAWTSRAQSDTGEDRKFAVLVAGFSEPVGFTALYGLFRQTAPELGILIGDRVPGVDGGRAAESLTLTKAFEEFGAHKVYGRIPTRNRAAKWVVESLGFQREALLRKHLHMPTGTFEDCEVWGVLPDAFREALP